jgi:hypothetical protein
MAANLTALAYKIAKQLHLVTESYTIYSSRSRRPVRKLLDTNCITLKDAVQDKQCNVDGQALLNFQPTCKKKLSFYPTDFNFDAIYSVNIGPG